MAKHEVFISWSGERSKQIAEYLKLWLPRIIQAVEPFVSTKDIEKGSFWFTEINNKLKEINLGIICLTNENKDKPWILFEAGALSKGLSINRVCTLLIDIEPKDITDPLARFNHTILEKDSFFQLITTINQVLGEEKIKDEVLIEIFSDAWDRFNERCHEIINNTKNSNASFIDSKRSNEEIIADILNVTRAIDKKIDMFAIGDAKVNDESKSESKMVKCGVRVTVINSALMEIEKKLLDLSLKNSHNLYGLSKTKAKTLDDKNNTYIDMMVHMKDIDTFYTFIDRLKAVEGVIDAYPIIMNNDLD